MNAFHGRVVLFGLALALVACPDEKPAPNPTPAPVGSPLASAQPSTKPSAKAPEKLVTPPDDQASADTWLAVRKDGVEIGLIELRSGKPPKLLAEEGASAAELRTKLEKIGGPGGIGLDMHLPTPTGEGRGPYGTRVIKYDDPLYRHALKEELEPEYDVMEIKRLVDEMPPAKFARLVVSRSGKKAGTLDFASTPPKLELSEPETGDVMGLRNNWDSVREKGELRVRYHVEKDGKETLVDVKVKPGDASYAQTVALYLIIERDYRKRYAYELEFEN